MKQRNFLANFEYKSYDQIRVINSEAFKFQAKNQLPSMEVKIDFVAGKLALQANWKFILQYNPHTEQRNILAHKKRVQIQMDIFSPGLIDLNDSSNNGLILPLEGNIMDESILNACNGMLVLENRWFNNQDSNLWRLAFYIYDFSAHYSEIKFDLPLYMVKGFQMN